jgi:hypothetical protein
VLKQKDKSFIGPYDLMYSLTCGIAEQDDDFETIAAPAAMILAQKFPGDFVVRQHLNWELHVKMLLQER